MKSLKPHTLVTLVVTVILFATIACGGSISSIPTASLFSTLAAQTQQAGTPLASPAPGTATPFASATLALPTSTSTSAPTAAAPVVANLPDATRINFAPGATNSVAQGTIQAGQARYYVVKAMKGQPMIVMLTTPDQSALLSVFGTDGVVFLSRAQQATNWQGTLPATQDYYFRVTGGTSTQNFTLNVNIPARILFESEQMETTLTGQTVGGYNVAYAAYAFAGQQMEVTIDTAPEVAALTIWGFSDGQPYARAQNGVTDFSMELPSTQDYIIEVVPQGGSVVDYQITVRIK